ncbi:MAG: double-strand break repair protein AddB [Alphaproteobacteria bacterium]|nr:double-strand break repair protein AddB [Alphaproteobacteria bacterium]
MAGVYNIPSEYSFLKSLANGLLRLGDKDPLTLAKMEVYLPTRRACLEVKRAFRNQNLEKPLLLPKFSPLGDLDEDQEWLSSPQDEITLKPVIPPFKRLGLLTNLIQEYTKKTELPSSPLLSLKLAKSLIKLMDQGIIEGVSWESLVHLVPAELAQHWQLTLNFLEIITTHWPKIIAETGFLEPYTHHHDMVEVLLKRWELSPPTHPILAAGSTGTMPATAKLLKAIAKLPQGAVILPGLDSSLRKEDLEDINPCHPQYAPTRFLERMDLTPSDIPLWPALREEDKSLSERASLFSHALKPSFSFTKPPSEKALDGITSLSCATPQEEALVIALLLRQHLEIPGQRIAFITSDLKLTERVRWELKRWDIEIDSSSGDALDLTPSGVFLKLCAEFAASPYNHVALLSLLKHPLFHMGQPSGAMRPIIRQFEKTCLRKGGFKTPPWLHNLYEMSQKLRSLKKTSLSTFAEEHRALAEKLTTDREGVCHLWKGGKGENVKAFFENIQKAAQDFPNLSLQDYPDLLKELFQGQNLHFRPQKHPRLAILGPIEARLFHADVMILGGLNEGSWPPDIDVDPWLNRPMRKEMGFPAPERRIGLSSHDFGQAFSSAKVYLTRALKVDGTPTLACRWLERLEVYLKGWNLSLPHEPHLLEWARVLDLPEKMAPLSPPLPTPPVDSRPRRLSVTQVETWMRDPYALYARHVLGLSPLDPLNPQVDASDRGTLIHNALDQFFKLCPDPLQKDALDILLFIGKNLFEAYEHEPSVRLFWWPRFQNLAQWFIQNERETRLLGTVTHTEIKGKLTLTTLKGPFECTAKADRIDILPNGALRLIDYKTGLAPSDQDVQLGFSPQLPLEGAIALQKGFEGISSTQIESLQFWILKGDANGETIKTLPGDPHELSSKALEGLEKMVRLFENETTPYPARPLPEKGLKYNDYAHLARLEEWGKI